MKNKFQVIKGGFTPEQYLEAKFNFAEVTNTRLMGVVALHIKWDFPKINSVLHQFFYFDCEENGFESCTVLKNDNPLNLQKIEGAIIKDLGGEKISLSENEAIFLVQEYALFNQRRNIPLPKNYDDYEFILQKNHNLSSKEKFIVLEKIQEKIVNDYQLINYFIMRLCGGDLDIIHFLSNISMTTEIQKSFSNRTFHRNSIENLSSEGLNTKTFKCHSIIERNGIYESVVSQVQTQDLKVTSFDIISQMKISNIEASLILSSPEYINLYETTSLNYEVVKFLVDNLTGHSKVLKYKNGECSFIFKKDNNHTKLKVYRLNGDIVGSIYIAYNGQIILTAHSPINIISLEMSLLSSQLSKHLQLVNKYEFHEPIFLDFLQSDIEDFTEFVSLIEY